MFRTTPSAALLTILASICLLSGASCMLPVKRPDGLSGRHTAAIEAAGTVSFSDDRTSVLKTLAKKDDLSETEQIFLINVVLHRGFSSDQADVLVILASNPCLTDKARMHLAERMGKISFSDDRRRIAAALADNPGNPVESDYTGSEL